MALTLAVGGLYPDTQARATTPEEVISYLNQQRRAYGIPPVHLDQSLLRPTCTLDNHHIASPSTTWSSTSSPWDEAPYHESFLFDPAGNRVSYGEFDGFTSNDPSFPSRSGTWSCMWFDFAEKYENAMSASSSPTFYWAAEASGPHAVPPSIWASEWPSTPAEDLGLPPTTGPNLLVYSIGLQDPHITSASVSTEGRSADVRVIQPGKGSAIAWGGVVVMSQPAQPMSQYEAKIVWSDGVEEEVCSPEYYMHPYCEMEVPPTFTQRFNFTTGAGEDGGERYDRLRRSPRLRATFRAHGRTVVGVVRFERGNKGGLQVVARCRRPKSRKAFRVLRRWPTGAKVKARVKDCPRLRIKTRIRANGEFKAGRARTRKLRVRTTM